MGCWMERLQFSAGWWLEAALSFLPHGPFHRAAHKMAAGLVSVSRGKSQRACLEETEVTVFYKLISEGASHWCDP